MIPLRQFFADILKGFEYGALCASFLAFSFSISHSLTVRHVMLAFHMLLVVFSLFAFLNSVPNFNKSEWLKTALSTRPDDADAAQFFESFAGSRAFAQLLEDDPMRNLYHVFRCVA